MKSAEHGNRNDLAIFRRINSTRERCVASERQVRSRFVIIGEVVRQNPFEMPVIEHNHVIETVSTNRSDESFGVRILPRRSYGRSDFFDAKLFHSFGEFFSVDSIVVA